MSRVRSRPALSAAACPAAVLWALWLVACGPSAVPSQDAAASLAGEELSYQRFEEYLARNVGEGEPQLGDRALSQLFDRFLTEELLMRTAVDRGLVPADAGRRQAVDALVAQAASEAAADEEVSRYYREHLEDFRRPERVRLRQILVTDRRIAEQAQAALRAGEDFAEVSRRWSNDPAAEAGGSQGELVRSDLPPAFAEVVFGLAPGEISPIVPAEYGFHIFQVTARLPEEVLSEEDVADQIRDRLHRRRREEVLEGLLATARDHYNVEIYERNLPFDYRGSYGSAQDSRR